MYAAVLSAFRAQGQSLVIHEENDGEALLTLVASGEGLTFFSESAAAIAHIGAVFKRVRDLDIVILGRLVWRAADEADPLIRSLLDLTRAVHEA
ncbi:LysR substrate-binding domain-containing protein [Sorangium sp. So ce1078]|uniref:LysR substrate-binding domain-containing protein n=1 Tax=Sorangium sp. So ce1078 TaxID=3133329 RepID=UPI003F5ED54E